MRQIIHETGFEYETEQDVAGLIVAYRRRADDAAAQAKAARERGDLEEAAFRSGLQCAYLGALGLLRLNGELEADVDVDEAARQA